MSLQSSALKVIGLFSSISSYLEKLLDHVDGIGVAMLSSSDLKSVLQSASKPIKSAVGSSELEEGQAMTHFEVAGWTANHHSPPPGF